MFQEPRRASLSACPFAFRRGAVEKHSLENDYKKDCLRGSSLYFLLLILMNTGISHPACVLLVRNKANGDKK